MRLQPWEWDSKDVPMNWFIVTSGYNFTYVIMLCAHRSISVDCDVVDL